MTKDSKKQIKAQAINECSKQYRERIKSLEIQICALRTKLSEVERQKVEAERENIKLKDELEKYQDWNRRLQEFMDMKPDVREKALAEIELRTATYSRLKRVLTIFPCII